MTTKPEPAIKPAKPAGTAAEPPEIKLLITLDAEVCSLRTDAERLRKLAEAKAAEHAATLATIDLDDARQLESLTRLDLIARIAPLQRDLITARLAEKEVELRAAFLAARALNKATAEKIACGHAELAARAFLPFCEDIREARDKGRDSKLAEHWFTVVRGVSASPLNESADPVPHARRVVADATNIAVAFAEVKAKLEAQGAAIPSLMEIVQPYR